MKAWLDLDSYTDFKQQSVPDPVKAELPTFVAKYLKLINEKLDHGTIVVWNNPDRLTYKSERPLVEHLVDDFGVTYRYLLDDRLRSLAGAVKSRSARKGRVTHQAGRRASTAHST